MLKKLTTTAWETWIFLGLSLIFAIIYGLLSLVNHYNFGTNAYDLGIFNQAIYSYAHLELGPNTLRYVPILLADHFEGILFLFSPFYWLFGSYTLLLIQIIAIIFGGLGIYLLLKKETRDKILSLGGTLIFFMCFGIFQAVVFDYHNHVIGVMLLPWLFYCLSLKKFQWYYIILGLFLICKENLSLMGVFLGLSILIFEEKKSKNMA